MSSMIILDYLPDELKDVFTEDGIPGYRARQIYDWVMKGESDFCRMNNLPKELRARLSGVFSTGIPEIIKKLVSGIDETRKYLLKFNDGEMVEAVLMKYRHGYSICISSQVGCKMGCAFCASAEGGFVRNLTGGEMLGQILTVTKDISHRISNVVVMGIGEPMDNYTELIRFIRLVNAPEGLNIGQRHITVSTSGLVPPIKDLAKRKLQITLAVSLHFTDDIERSKFMPMNRKYKIQELLNACRFYIKETGRRITFEYALIKGVNDSPDDAKRLAALLKGIMCHVNLIPINDIKKDKFVKSNERAVCVFSEILTERHIENTVRRELGTDISAACGQLRRG